MMLVPLGIILGFIGNFKEGQNGMAIASILIGFIAVILNIFFAVVINGL